MLSCRVSTLLLFFFWRTVVTAYSLPGGYERVLYYQMYLLDIDANGFPPKNVAHECHRIMRTSGDPCSFDQFVEHIREHTSTEPLDIKNYPRFTKKTFKEDRFLDIDNIAKKVDSMGFANRVTPGFVHKYHIKKGTQYHLLLSTMGQELEQLLWRLEPKDPLVNNAITSLQQLYATRQEATFRSFVTAVNKEREKDARWGEPERTFKEVHDGLEVKAPFFEAEAYSTKHNIKQADVEDLWIRTEGDGHRNNNLVLRDAFVTVLETRKYLDQC